MVDVRAARPALTLVLAGSLVYVVDITNNGFDLLPDLLGALVGWTGAIRLARAAPEIRLLRTAAWLSFLPVADAAIDLSRAGILIGLLVAASTAAAVLTFAVGASHLCRALGLPEIAGKWLTAAKVFGYGVVLPVSVLFLSVGSATGWRPGDQTPRSAFWGPVAFAVVAVWFGTTLFLFRMLWTTRRALGGGVAAGHPTHARL